VTAAGFEFAVEPVDAIGVAAVLAAESAVAACVSVVESRVVLELA